MALCWPPLGQKENIPIFHQNSTMEEELDGVLYLSFSPFAVKGVLSIKYFRYYLYQYKGRWIDHISITVQ